MTKQTAFIKDWFLEKFPDGYRLIGNIQGHSRQKEFLSKQQVTSNVVRIDFINKTAETLNTVYTLGEDNEQIRID